ncbi:hypothetical protein, partial [Pedobacter sp. ASV12]|uniref:hypothetical protein n=1 Tax=Pedobacter sp. ASV12 TaxID=2795120 RepID=UPI0018EDE596
MKNNMDLVLHNRGVISIKDIDGDLNISQPKWDFLINLLIDYSECTFFSGLRLNYDDNIEKNIDYLAEEILINKDEDFEMVLLKINERNIRIHRGLLECVWKQYQNPYIIFLNNSNNVDILVNTIREKRFYNDFLRAIEGLCIIYQEYES